MMEAKFRTDKLQNGNCDTADNFVSPNTADFKTQTSHTVRFKNTATPQAEILFTATPHEKMRNTANPQCPPLICRLYAQCMISKSHVKQCSAWLFLWCYWTSKQCIVKRNVTIHRQGIHHWLVFNKCLKETLLESTKNGCQRVDKILREPTKFSSQFYESLLKATSCLSSAYWTLVYLTSKLSDWLAQQENLLFCGLLYSTFFEPCYSC